MAFRGGTATSGQISSDKIREQLDRVLNSKTFLTVERLKQFVTFIVVETLEGRSDKLKEFVIGVEVFHKESAFDPRNDPIVRVQARRLRTRLARYYAEEGQNDEILIELPKGGYSTLFKRRESTPPGRPLTVPLAGRNTIAVLPFSDDSPTGSLDYFCRGIRQEIVSALAKADGIRVVAWDSSQTPANGHSTEAAGHPNAATAICGSVRKSGDELRITSHIVDGESGCYLWSQAIDRKIGDEFAVQEEVAQSVLEKLQAGRVGGGHGSSARRPTDNLAAHNLYLQGRYHLSQRTEEGLRKAGDFFEKAIMEDARYAEAYAGLADAYELLGHYGALAPAEVWTKAASNAAFAVELNDRSAEAHTSLAHVKSTQDWDWHGAEREFQRAIQLDPDYPTAHHWYAVSCLAPRGRLDEALLEMQLAQSLDPISSIVARDLAVIYYYRRDFEAALEQCDQTIELNPHFTPAYWTLGLVQEQLEDFDESAAAFQRAIQLSPRSPRMQGALGHTFARCGKREEALGVLREMHRLAETRYVSPFEIASIYFALGQADRGFEWLRKALQDRCFELSLIKVDPRFDSISSDQRFILLSSELGLD